MLASVIRIIAHSITLVKHIIHLKKSSNLNNNKMILCIICVTILISVRDKNCTCMYIFKVDQI